MSDEFRILFVCAANHCRSPMAEYLLRQQAMEADVPWLIGSAGTEALPDQPVHPLVAELLAARGLDTSSFRSRALSPELLKQQNLVLTMTDSLRSEVIQAEPRVASRTFTLRQLSHLLLAATPAAEAASHQRGPDLLRRAQRGRTLTQPLQDDRDIADPMGRPLAAFEQCLADLDSALWPFLN